MTIWLIGRGHVCRQGSVLAGLQPIKSFHSHRASARCYGSHNAQRNRLSGFLLFSLNTALKRGENKSHN
jgi:hypothetical protein